MNLQAQLCTWENLQLAYQSASRGKRGREATASFELYLADHLLDLENELSGRTYQPGKYSSFHIHEPKRRLISAAPFRDRVVHHALCNITSPYFEKKFSPDSYANRVGKGTHRALDRAQHFSNRYPYVLQCDVKKFFPSIDHAILKAELLKFLPDESVLWLIERILQSGCGVLSEEYEMAYLRYVDDFLLFSESKTRLWEWRSCLIKRLERYRLTIHEENALPRPTEKGFPFLGFVMFPDHRLLKRRTGMAFQRRMKKMLGKASSEQIRASLQGWINHARYADTYALRASVLESLGLLTEVEYA
jgi:RNA-directed DNA polymerase